MSQEMTEEIEFTVACVNEFAQKYGMANADALRFLDSHQGLDYVLNGYATVRNQPLDLTLEDLRDVCRRNGGVFA